MPHNYHSMKCFLSNINCAVINLKKKVYFCYHLRYIPLFYIFNKDFFF